jgi:excreted virulence factor EspC (type VII ESX diderm)
VAESGFDVVPQKVREVGQQVVQISQDVGSIVSSGAATITLAGSGNAGFLTTPAMAALTASHLAALKNLGGQLQQHGADLGGTAQTYEAVDRDQQNAAITSAVPVDTTWSAS